MSKTGRTASGHKRSEDFSHTHKAKVFMTGRSQAIRLPRELRVATKEVYVRRTSQGLVITTKNPWELFHEGVRQLSPGVLEERPAQPPLQERDWEAE